MVKMAGYVFTAALALAFARGGFAASDADTEEFSGVVTRMRVTDDYFFARAKDGRDWRVSMDGKPRQRFATGDLVHVRGLHEKQANRHTTRLFACDVAKTGHDDATVPPPCPMTFAELYARPEGGVLPRPDWYARLVVVEGMVRDFWRRDSTTTLVLDDGRHYIRCQIAEKISTPMPEHLENGARVRTTGIAVYSSVWGEGHVLSGFDNVNLLVQDFRDVEVVSGPPWWTPVRVWTVLGVTVFALVLLSVWTALLLRANRAERAALAEAERSRRERLRLSADLHDNFQQLLAGTMCRIKAAGNWLDDDRELARRQLELAKVSLGHTQNALRAALWGMTEESEGPRGFEALMRYAISRMAHWEGIVTLLCEGREPRWARRYAPVLLMVLQEAVGNAVTHGAAANVRVRVRFSPDALVLAICDDGCGFDAAAVVGSDHLGIAGMKSRVREIGGRLRIVSVRGRGTRVVAGLLKGDDDVKPADC